MGWPFSFFQGAHTRLTTAIEAQEFNKRTLKVPEQRNKQTSEGSQARHSGALKA